MSDQLVEDKPLSVPESNQVDGQNRQPTTNHAGVIPPNGQAWGTYQETRIWNLPYPPPEVLEHYQHVIPDGANRLLTMSENEQKHRHSVIDRREERDSNEQTFAWSHRSRGQILGFILALIGILGGVVLIGLGKSATGFGTFFTSLAALIGLFVYAIKVNEPKDTNKADPEPKQMKLPNIN